LSFSILTSFRLGGVKYVFSFIATEWHDKPLFAQALERVYNYLFGPGVAVRWQRPLHVEICDLSHEKYHQLAHNSIEKWQEVVGEQLEITAQDSTSCPPFSDLNSHVVYLVRGWTRIQSPEVASPAFVVPVANPETSDIITASMFILENEWTKSIRGAYSLNQTQVVNHPEVLKVMERTLIHEFGHMLGLHHMFDPETPSIMSYDSSVNTIQEYDERAMNLLYAPPSAE
jgi:hypothetical protein